MLVEKLALVFWTVAFPGGFCIKPHWTLVGQTHF